MTDVAGLEDAQRRADAARPVLTEDEIRVLSDTYLAHNGVDLKKDADRVGMTVRDFIDKRRLVPLIVDMPDKTFFQATTRVEKRGRIAYINGIRLHALYIEVASRLHQKLIERSIEKLGFDPRSNEYWQAFSKAKAVLPPPHSFYITIDGRVTTMNDDNIVIQGPSVVSVGYASPNRWAFVAALAGNNSGNPDYAFK